MALSSADRRGITCLIVGGVGFSASDALTKLSALSLPFGEVLAVRGLFSSLLFLALLTARGQLSDLRIVGNRAVLGRSLFDVLGTITFVLAISNARLGDSTAIVLSSPIFMTLLAIFMYGERVGWHRWSAIILGIAGVVLITKPEPQSFSYWTLLAAVAAICSAGRDLVTRSIGMRANSLVVALVSPTILCVIGGALSTARGDWVAPDARLVAILAATGACYAFGMTLNVQAFRGPITVSLVSPFRYVMLVWSLLFGLFMFGEPPDAFTIGGSLVIIASGLYVLHREMVLGRALTATTPER
ncbi:MAG: DMT family transporter [Pseudolabrys sp.]